MCAGEVGDMVNECRTGTVLAAWAIGGVVRIILLCVVHHTQVVL